ncbi:PiggyBac transposase uribo2 [Plakobranchus ocellatus]|uniref:PiggyBac transposase uribo2 n=1 Tax=Plakobranchus ocellatus TaxID=259542 RepID=A0AAV4AZZ4_9GAST|nr:PiggyBac transposase uribo2 [Plakobranchus ocellatus]
MQSTPWFGKHFNRDRYYLLLTFLHFNNNDNLPAADHPDFKLHKIQPVITDLIKKFLRFYRSHKNILIDESMVGYKGKTPHLRQYIPNKHHARFGIKLWCLCDSTSSYTSSLKSLKGAADSGDRQAEGMTYTLVLRMMEVAGLFHRGHHLGLDNYFTSPALLYDLYGTHVSATGTVRRNRKGLPKSVTSAKLDNKHVAERKRGNLLCVSYKDGSKQPVLLSTQAKAGFCLSTNSKGKEKRLPTIIKL